MGLTWILEIVCYPVAEELVFRWGVLRELDVRIPKLRGWLNNILVSALFALVHVPVWGWAHALSVFLPSLLLGWVFQRTGSITLCIMLHSAMNWLGRIYEMHGFD